MRLYQPKMGEQTKQVRVDNWGIFFLQRLQMFFSKTDYCDMTLQFEGNVQLKVHRLVLNACTEYFQVLEQSCSMDENVIMMPADLQADVIVPIVNFMYTGMLEFHLSIYERLYKTAQLMNITILTKLLDAQKQPLTANKMSRKRRVDSPIPTSYTPTAKKSAPVKSELPATLPGRKLPIWKRKSVPMASQPLACWSAPSATDPLATDVPKPTRFEWPEDDLPSLPLMDTSFEDISYTSKPLMTQEEENRASTSFDDIRQTPNAARSGITAKHQKKSNSSIDMEEVKNYVKEQKIRSGISGHDEETVDNDLEMVSEGGKRKIDLKIKSVVNKKVRFDESSTTINITTDGKSASELDHEKIVAEILRKYPQLVKKKKNITLKIMAKNSNTVNKNQGNNRQKIKVPDIVPEKAKLNSGETSNDREDKSPWICDRCSTEDEPVEFVLYYLYRKHMTDVHNEKIDSKLCRYCGRRCSKQNLLMYHLYTKHGMKPPSNYTFPKCDQCPYIALSLQILMKHKMKHNKDEVQCLECKLTFTCPQTLTSHMQITGHTGKSQRSNYDCQYCTKRYQSGVNLFSHVRMQHRNEAIRDGIVSVDEDDEVEDYDDEEEEEEDDDDGCSKDEYILPEIISDAEAQQQQLKAKVNILSNVKVQDRVDSQRQISLEPSSEAEALNNVATGIATSLGLVDIVVLNDNQQLFVHENEDGFSGDNSEQPEFILPELSGQEQTLSDIGSTDELVMVLTDHDYGDNQEEISGDNSNIVVLYSHPVDGDHDQFITSQGNIMVNSQTGMIEIRNGSVGGGGGNEEILQESHIESIEMIQREIENGGELKQESLAVYDEDTKDDRVSEESGNEKIDDEPGKGPINQSDALVEGLVQGQQLEFTAAVAEDNEDLTESQVNVEEAELEEADNSSPQVDTEVVETGQEPDEVEEEEEEEAIVEQPVTADKSESEEPLLPAQTTEEVTEVVEENQAPQTKPTEEEETSNLTQEQSQSEEAPPIEINETNETAEVDTKAPEDKNNELECTQSDTSTASQATENKEYDKDEGQSAKISILDDWEDTDSQQSNSNNKEEDAEEVAIKVGASVNKLMDEWEEEEEDNKDE